MTDKSARIVMTTLIAALLLFLAIGSISALAVQTIGSGGTKLDANLMVGSGGYNRPVQSRSYMHRQSYGVGSSRPLYTVNTNGVMVYNPHNAFTPRQRYHPTGYTGDFTSHSYHRRFRYIGY